MANRVFQSVIYQMKDAIDRVVGVVDETGASIACSELNLIGEVQEDFVAERVSGKDSFARGGYSYQQFSSAKHNDYAVFVRAPTRRPPSLRRCWPSACRASSSTTMRSSTKPTSSKTWCWTTSSPATSTPRPGSSTLPPMCPGLVFIVRVVSGGDISAYDVVSSLFPDKQKDFVFNISETDTVLVKEIRKGIDRTDMEKLAASIVDTLSGNITSRLWWASAPPSPT